MRHLLIAAFTALSLAALPAAAIAKDDAKTQTKPAAKSSVQSKSTAKKSSEKAASGAEKKTEAAPVALAQLAVGKPAPDFKVKDIAGKSQSISQYKGKNIVLEWTNAECPFVRKHYESENMQNLQDYATVHDTIWLKINSSAKGKQGYLNDKDAKKYQERYKSGPAAYIVDADGKLGKLYGATATPHMFVIDKSGNIVYMGAIDNKPTTDVKDIEGAKNYVKAAIDGLLDNKPIEVASTKPYGCPVKYKD